MLVGCPPPPSEEPDCWEVPSPAAAACSFLSDAEPPLFPPSFCAVSEPHAPTNANTSTTNKSEKGLATLRTNSIPLFFCQGSLVSPLVFSRRDDAILNNTAF